MDAISFGNKVKLLQNHKYGQTERFFMLQLYIYSSWIFYIFLLSQHCDYYLLGLDIKTTWLGLGKHHSWTWNSWPVLVATNMAENVSSGVFHKSDLIKWDLLSITVAWMNPFLVAVVIRAAKQACSVAG